VLKQLIGELRSGLWKSKVRDDDNNSLLGIRMILRILEIKFRPQ